tara:strand:+ start:5333 stop:5776 length:444 start_codon:yes stop_codon:yes gene_type:complete
MYTELFFLDEVTALAAGHRPCAECRRERFNEFKQAWQAARSQSGDRKIKVAEIDSLLHVQRMPPDGSNANWQADLTDLPVGTIIECDDSFYAVHTHGLLPWSLDGYGKPVNDMQMGEVTVVTPRATVAALAAGFRPVFHQSAQAVEE